MRFLYLILLLPILSCQTPVSYDIVLQNTTIYDGSGEVPYLGDIGINADTIAAIGTLDNAIGIQEIDASGLVVAPGFINMLSWAVESLIEDGKSQSDIRQGVTLEVFGEGWSMGPLNDNMKEESLKNQGILAISDLRNEKIGYKIREHTIQKVPYLLVVGDREVEADSVAVRVRGEDLGSMPLQSLIDRLDEEVTSRGHVLLED